MSQIAEIDCGYLAEIQAKEDEVWTNPIQKADLIADAEAARAVLENQQVRLGELQDKQKTKTVAVEWLTHCDLASQACSDDCTITGDDATPECKEYAITCLREVPFKVYDRVYRTRTINPEESIAFNLLMAKKILDEYIANYIVTSLVANAGTNLYTGGVGTVGAAVTTISAANWNDNIWSYFAMVNRMNKFNAPYGITGENLFSLIYNRLAEFANADGKGNVNKMGDLRARMYLDPENVEAVAAHYTFLLHKTAAAFINKAWYPLGAANAQKLTADRFAWSEASQNLPGVVYDIFTERGCSSNDYYTAFKVQLHGTFALNPTPCTATHTGILAFACS